MVHKQHVENFLRLNGIPMTAPDEEIRSALFTARWHADDVEVALLALRGEVGKEDIEVITARQLFHTDSKISPEALSSLLGITINAKSGHVHEVYHKEDIRHQPFLYFTLVLVLAGLIAFIGIVFAMYALHVGPFYSPIEHL